MSRNKNGNIYNLIFTVKDINPTTQTLKNKEVFIGTTTKHLNAECVDTLLPQSASV